MNTIENLLETLRLAHCDNAQKAYYARRHPGQSNSTMPATSFVFEFLLFNSLYQYDWSRSCAENRLVPWQPEELSESKQQRRLEAFVLDRCRANPSILQRAFDPLTSLTELDGEWTLVTPDARITPEQGRSFFTKLAKLRDRIHSGSELTVSGSLFELIEGCRYFVYLVRNNIFHGSKSIGDVYEPSQRRRIEAYDLFLKCLVSLFFLAVDERKAVAADYVQLPVRIPIGDGAAIDIGQSDVAELVASDHMKPEDSRLMREFFSQIGSRPERPGPRDALFYPSSGSDILTPVLLGLPFCSQFFLYDTGQTRRANLTKEKLWRLLEVRPHCENVDGDESSRFDFRGTPRIVHVVRADNRDYLARDVDLAFYFRRGDSAGEGGSNQRWDSRHLADLGQKIADAGTCQIVTDGEPGGLHADLRSRLHAFSVAISHRSRDYFMGGASKNVLTELNGIKATGGGPPS
jgi:hypothetical protein